MLTPGGLRQRHILFGPGHDVFGETACCLGCGGWSIAIPPLPPEEIERVQALKAVQVMQLTVAEQLVALGVHQRVAAP